MPWQPVRQSGDGQSAAAQALTASRDLARQSDELRAEVEHFLQDIRAA
jgi:hypothetical protein